MLTLWWKEYATDDTVSGTEALHGRVGRALICAWSRTDNAALGTLFSTLRLSASAIASIDVTMVKIATKDVAATEGALSDAEISPRIFLVSILLGLSIVVMLALLMFTVMRTVFLVRPEVLLSCRIKARSLFALQISDHGIGSGRVILFFVLVNIIALFLVILTILTILRHIRGKWYDVALVGARWWQDDVPFDNRFRFLAAVLAIIICGLKITLGLGPGLDLNFILDRPNGQLADDFIDDSVLAFETQLFV